MRSSRNKPVSLSNSYLTLEPIGISMTVVNSLGRCCPGVTSCHAWVMASSLFIWLLAWKAKTNIYFASGSIQETQGTPDGCLLPFERAGKIGHDANVGHFHETK